MITNPLREDFRRRVDPGALAAAVGLLPLDPWQRKVLESASRRIIMLSGRQVGKSSVTSVLAIWEMLYHPGSTTLILAPNLRIAQELYLKAVTLFRAIGRPVTASAETTLTLTLVNGSRLICIPGANPEGIRGFTADLVVIDEAARVSDETYAAVRAVVSVSRGRVVLLSTPGEKSGFFWREWSAPGNLWEKYSVRSDECPRVDVDWLAEERRSLPESIYASEHECTFIPQGSSSLFADADLVDMVDPRIQPLGGAWD